MSGRRARREQISPEHGADPRPPGDGREAIEIRVQSRAGRNELVGERGGKIVVRLTAPPVDGRANRALRKLIAKRLGVAQGRVEVVRGARSPDKLVRVSGLEPQAVRARLLSR